jgi:hypothetical protein
MEVQIVENEQGCWPPHQLTFDQAEVFLTALTDKQFSDAMIIFDNIRPSYPNIRDVFVESVRLKLCKVAKELGI